MADVEAVPSGDDLEASPTANADVGDTLEADGANAAALDVADQAAEAEEARASRQAVIELAGDGAAEEPATLKLPLGTLTRKTDRLREARQTSNAQREDWKCIGEELKPNHLKVPSGVYHIVSRLMEPTRQHPLDVVEAPPRHSSGVLEPKAKVDPTVVRSFVHRVDTNRDDLVEPKDLSEISIMRSMGITDDQIMSMFERIIGFRPPGGR
jgi:hypothetical protein